MKFKAIERINPQNRTAPKKWYAQLVIDGEVSIDELVVEIEKFCSLSEPDIRASIIALENVVQNKLAAGKIVRFDKLGNLYPTLSSEPRDTQEEVDAHCIKSVSVNYRAGKRILDAMKNASKKKE